MSNYNVTRFFGNVRHSLKGGSFSFLLKTQITLEKIRSANHKDFDFFQNPKKVKVQAF